MSPAEIAREWRERQRAMKEGTPFAKEYHPVRDWLLELCQMLADAMTALINEQIEEDGRKKKH